MLLQKRTVIPGENDDDTEKDKDKDSSEPLKLIMASSGLLLNLINNMLDVKRVQEGSKYDEWQMAIANNAISFVISFVAFHTHIHTSH